MSLDPIPGGMLKTSGMLINGHHCHSEFQLGECQSLGTLGCAGYVGVGLIML